MPGTDLTDVIALEHYTEPVLYICISMSPSQGEQWISEHLFCSSCYLRQFVQQSSICSYIYFIRSFLFMLQLSVEMNILSSVLKFYHIIKQDWTENMFSDHNENFQCWSLIYGIDTHFDEIILFMFKRNFVFDSPLTLEIKYVEWYFAY